MSRPTQYRDEFAVMAEKLALLGLTDTQTAFALGVSERTLNRWKKQYPGFCQSLKNGKALADAKVAHALYRKATGYTYQLEEIRNVNGRLSAVPVTRHQPPDTTACIFWLKNRQPELWRDKPDPLPEKEIIVVHNALQIPGAVQPLQK
ncbi:terminase [Enterobacter cloacae subsp. cloacae]|uniref:helix-turn-helix domain-containing protein n=1 Tax=Enterobacter cloacae TaxID=550 RepID=UPI001C5B0996|nr:helix-turn-helix domain-containing protein [Enterobacter cloacae]ELK6492357.1 terminase [Enterobacter bugandensis]MBW4199526.1 terminase [Enterobacter cloacae subsp. cloacae]